MVHLAIVFPLFRKTPEKGTVIGKFLSIKRRNLPSLREGAFETAQRCLSENIKAKGISVIDQPKKEMS